MLGRIGGPGDFGVIVGYESADRVGPCGVVIGDEGVIAGGPGNFGDGRYGPALLSANSPPGR